MEGQATRHGEAAGPFEAARALARRAGDQGGASPEGPAEHRIKQSPHEGARQRDWANTEGASLGPVAQERPHEGAPQRDRTDTEGASLGPVAQAGGPYSAVRAEGGGDSRHRDRRPLVADLMCGPNAPVAKAFIMCGWRVMPVDWKLDPSHDLADEEFQRTIRGELKAVDAIVAAFDCSTKSAVRSMPCKFDDGRPVPRPLRSVEFPMGLPDLKGPQKRRVARDNDAAEFILEEMGKLADRGGASLRENPENSLHWATPTEVSMWESGHWWDKRYDACVLQGARRKRQRLRHDVQEICDWPVMQCHHVHSGNEWRGGEETAHRYPQKEEAEYTACLAFHISVAFSWWAMRTGRAVLRVPRCPSVSALGDRRGWLELDPRAMRGWSMIPQALALGLEIPLSFSPERLPVRGQVPPRPEGGGTKGEGEPLQGHEVYVGSGHHSHKYRCSKWASPFTPGLHGTREDTLVQYVDHLHSTGLVGDIGSLRGMTLLCDCPPNVACVADVLVAEYYQHAIQQEECKGSGTGGKASPPWGAGAKGVSLGLLAAQSSSAEAVFREFGGHHPPRVKLPRVPWRRWPQEALVALYVSFFPPDVFEGFKFPMVEDLINAAPFVTYFEWREAQGLHTDGPLGPARVTRTDNRAFRASGGQQVGAYAHKAALPPLVSFGTSPDEHFQAALAVGCMPSPLEVQGAHDEDLLFAAEMTKVHGRGGGGRRLEAVAAIRELKHRWRSVTHRLKRAQTVTVHAVTRKRDIGLLTLLAVLISWPDTTFGFHLTRGFPAVGFVPWSGVFERREVSPVTQDAVWVGAKESNARIRATLRPSACDAVITAKTAADCEKGFCTPAMTQKELERKLKGKHYRLIRRFAIEQAGGRFRVIDDGADGGQSESSVDANRLRFCSALQPAYHVALLAGAYAAEGRPLPPGGGISSGGEDWPDAYRFTPMDPEDSLACVVVYWHDEWGALAYHIYHGLLFGLPNAVTSFNRFSRLAEALVRRLLFLLFSMYFDDGTMQDWGESAAGSQRAVAAFMELIGSPWSKEKTQPCAPTADFLGLVHDLQEVDKGVVSLWPREKLVGKVDAMVCAAFENEKLTPGAAAKLYGLANFLESGMFGKLGRAGLNPIKDRAQAKGQQAMTAGIRSSLELVRELMLLRPRRSFQVGQYHGERFVVASDAAYEAGVGTGGFLVVMRPNQAEESRHARVVELPQELYEIWGEQVTYIAQLELYMILAAVTSYASDFRDKRGVWFVDNIAALMALVRGRSNSESLDQMALRIHAALFSIRAWVYFEWVSSEANWSDGISRDGLADQWQQRHSFQPGKCIGVPMLLRLPVRAAVTVFEHL